MNALTGYKKNTTKTVEKGRVIIRCKLGEWVTSSLCNSKAEKAAQELYLKAKGDK